MKKLVLTTIACVGLTASVLAQGSMLNVNNFQGAGGPTATSFGLFFNSSGNPYTGASITATVLAGPDAANLAALTSGPGGMNAGTMLFAAPGVYFDQTFQTYNVAGVAAGANATVQVQAWADGAASYGASADKFYAWNGATYVDASTFTFVNPTGGGGTPPGLPKDLDGMPAMSLQVIPEPSVLALTGLGLGTLLLFRRRK